MENLLNTFKQRNYCDTCSSRFIPLDGCMFKCGHIYHTSCIKSMDNPRCFKCDIPYNPHEIYILASKFMNKALDLCFDPKNTKNIGKKAFDLLIEAALLDHSESQFIIGNDNFINKYVKNLYSKEDNIFWLNKAANNKHLNAIFALMNMYKDTDLPLYYKYCKMAADENDSYSQVILALHYEKTDVAKCLYYMSKASLNNYTMADQYLYTFYTEGKIIKKNTQLAEEYLIKIANTGDTNAQVCVGDLYYNKNQHTEAIHWYKLAADKGHNEAQIQLANYYMLGDYVEVNYPLAYKLLSKNRENPFAMFLIGHYYECYKKNYDDSFQWYLKSAKKGLCQAQYKLSYLYEHGLGITQNKDESFDWLLKAADNKHLDSQKIIGQKYEIGFNYKGKFMQSDKKAKKYYQLASNEGDLFSVNALYFYEVLSKFK
jgi:TPR repeat protein